MKSAITISLVCEAKGGPFVYWEGLRDGCVRAKEAGFDAVEIFAPNADVVEVKELRGLVEEFSLEIAAFGTGAGWLLQKLSLSSRDVKERERAIVFVKELIDLGSQFGAPSIIGSMQGKFSSDETREEALERLGESLEILGEYARERGLVLLYEALNRYETNLLCTQADAAKYLRGLSTTNIKMLSDLFHMNIEEQDIAHGLRDAGELLGHVHFVDSNRQAAGFGHMEYGPIAEALQEIKYTGYLSVEAFPKPNSDEAAQKSISTMQELSLV